MSQRLSPSENTAVSIPATNRPFIPYPVRPRAPSVFHVAPLFHVAPCAHRRPPPGWMSQVGITSGTIEVMMLQPILYWKNASQQVSPRASQRQPISRHPHHHSPSSRCLSVALLPSSVADSPYACVISPVPGPSVHAQAIVPLPWAGHERHKHGGRSKREPYHSLIKACV